VNLDAVRRVADAVLYEGYILYPYRASAAKNRSRWQFGVLMPPGYTVADPSETSFTQAECVFEHSGRPSLRIIVRFLQVQRRTDPAGATWDEAVEREIEVGVGPEELLGEGLNSEFTVEGGEDREPAAGGNGAYGDTVRRREPLAGAVSVRTTALPGPWGAVRLQVRVENLTVPNGMGPNGMGPAVTPEHRAEALPSALVAAHVIMSISGGDFLSMTDPPLWAKAAVAECENVGGWPVLADPDGGRDVMLSAPIILYDHPELAAESPGELYDGTEIDEILTLRTLALSDDEKLEARATDPRAAALIDRVESLDAEAMGRMHGAIRFPGAASARAGRSSEPPQERDQDVPWWDPDAEAAVSPDTDSVVIAGQKIARGSRVRLRPGARRSDAQDMFLIGRVAEVQAVLLDVDDNPYLAVSLADTPDEDLRIAHGRFLYFATDEVEPCEGQP
jgi:hypothetical protein